MSLSLDEDAFGDLRNARFMAVAADLAYLPATEGSAAFSQKLGMTGELISRDNSQAWVVGNADHLVVAFRGTESPATLDGIKDWLLTDAMNLLIVPEGRLGTDFIAAGVGARFHKGFMDALAEIWSPLLAKVQAELAAADRPLWITGHSLGGAMATLAGWLFLRKMIPVHQMYTYGAPMIGNAAAARALDQEYSGKMFRYVNAPDPVPRLPTMSLIANSFHHVEREVPLGAAADSASTLAMLQSFASETVDGVLNASLADRIWKSVLDRVNAHLMGSYQKLIG